MSEHKDEGKEKYQKINQNPDRKRVIKENSAFGNVELQ
jgi:hypothetical protein